MSFSKCVLSMREEIAAMVYSYLSCARGIDDLDKEEDIDDFLSQIDGIIEENVAQFKKD